MTVSDSESKLDESERDDLQKAISAVERRVAFAASGEHGFFEPFLQNMRGRLAMLEKKIKESHVEKENRAKEVVEHIQAAEKEKALSAPERETFGNFLKEQFFTKKDFGRLEDFYAHSWERLSESGKDELSKRVWEGIRRDEYKFTELPKVVQDKEAERAYRRLRDSAIGVGDAKGIPENDRNEFIRAYESGEHTKAGKILERESFRQSMFLGASSTETKDLVATRDREKDAKGVEASTGTPTAKQPEQAPPETTSKSDVDASAFNLDGLKIAEAPATISSRDIPAAANSPKGAQSFRGR
jgi:hypothetical protein